MVNGRRAIALEDEKRHDQHPDTASCNHWITNVESDHIGQAIAKILQDPKAIASRTAWHEAVARGAMLFNDPALGTTGKTCRSCHPATSLKNVEDRYPKFNPDLKRFVDMQEAINMMLKDKMNGTLCRPTTSVTSICWRTSRA